MSLLTNPWFQVGMGLLSNSGPSLTPVNPWQGVNQGLMNAADAQQMEKENAYRQWQMEQQREQAQRAEEQRRYAEEMAGSAPLELRDLALAYPDAYAKARADQAFSAPGETTQLSTAGQLGLQGFDPNTPVQVKMKGGAIVDYAPINPPEAPKAQIKLEKGGQVYTAGSVEEANKMAQEGWTYYRPPPTTSISLGENDKPVTVSDAKSMEYPDGSPVLPGTPYSEVYARGARARTSADDSAATLDAQIKQFEEQLKMATTALKDAAEAYKKAPTADNYQRVMMARNAAATALGQRRNIKGEPSGEIVEGALADIPAPLSAGTMAKEAMGGDPLEASLRQIDRQYNLGIYPQNAPANPSASNPYDKYGLTPPPGGR